MLAFSKAISTGKTAQEAAEEEEKKQLAAEATAKKLDEIEQAKQEEQEAVDKEEEDERQHAIDVTERKMLAARYERMMIEDEHRDNSDGDGNFKVIADQAAEQNYAVNVYKGSGEMAVMLDQLKMESEENRQKEMLAQAA